MPLLQPAPSIRQIIERTAARFGVPLPIALGVAYVESRFNPTARNARSGATGLFQLMPRTAAALGVSDMTDPQQSAEGGLKFLASLRRKWGSWAAALAAYNWGPGNLGRALDAGRSWPDSVQRRYVDPVMSKASEYAAALGLPIDGVSPAPEPVPEPTTPPAPAPGPSRAPQGLGALATVAGVLGLLLLLNRRRGASV